MGKIFIILQNNKNKIKNINNKIFKKGLNYKKQNIKVSMTI
jgi:hypothetical protein